MYKSRAEYYVKDQFHILCYGTIKDIMYENYM